MNEPISHPLRRAREVFDEHVSVAEATRLTLLPAITGLAADLAAAISTGGKLVVFGNGGSAADAQHFAAELTGHFVAQRGPLAAIALTTDTSALTAIANDYGHDQVFARQATALCARGDVVVGISTSGNAESVIKGVEAAKARGALTYGFTGGTGGRLREVADRLILVPSAETARIQEMHITIIHIVCLLLDDLIATPPNGEGS